MKDQIPSTKSLSWKKQFSNLGYLLKNSFTIIGRNNEILTPWIRNIIYTLIVLVLFFGGIISFVVGAYTFGFLCIFGWMIMGVYLLFYLNYQEMRLSWLVYKTVTGSDCSYREACNRSGELKSQVRLIALADFVMNLISTGKGRTNEGFMGFIVSLFIEGLEEVWDLANHYLIPHTAVEGTDLSDGIENMKELKDQVPESLMGIFGIEIVGSAAKAIIFPVHLVFFLIAVLIGALAPSLMPEASIIQLPSGMAESLSFILGADGRISWFPILPFFLISFSISGVIKRTITAIKVTYFTIFYTRISHPEDIVPELQDELTRFLKMDEEE